MGSETVRHACRAATPIAAMLLFTLCVFPATAPAEEKPAVEKTIPAVATGEPLGVFIFSSARFKRGELDEYFDEMEGDFFSRENDTLTSAMQNLAYYAIANGTEFDVVNPSSYKRMNNPAKVEIFRTQRKIAAESKFDKNALAKYALLLDFRYILVGDLLKMKTWKMEGLEDGCEMEMTFVLYDARNQEFIRNGNFAMNTRVPPDRRIPGRRLRELGAGAADLARSPHGYCFLDIAGQLIDSLLPAEVKPPDEEKAPVEEKTGTKIK